MEHKGLNPALAEDAARRERWAYLTEGVKDDRRRWVTEAMLDNVQAWTQIPSVREDTLQTNVGAFTTFAFPLIRRIYPRLIATELFSVQPMSQPTGKVFFLDFKYGTGADDGNRIDLKANFNKAFANSSEGASVAEINMDISSTTVTAIEKKLKAEWSIEAQQDLYAYHGLNAESELMAVLGDEILREIDRELIDHAVDNAGAGNVNWDAAPASYATWDYSQRRAYDESLYGAIVDANNAIFKKRYRNATWIVADADTCARLEKLEGFKLADNSDANAEIQHGGRHLFGTLKTRWKIYKDPWFTTNKMLLGFKGDSFLDAGLVYAPYIPVYVTPLFVDPATFKPRRGMMSRYAKQMVVSDCFATVTVTNAS